SKSCKQENFRYAACKRPLIRLPASLLRRSERPEDAGPVASLFGSFRSALEPHQNERRSRDNYCTARQLFRQGNELRFVAWHFRKTAALPVGTRLLDARLA